jgi:hypothetical protein
MLVVDTYRQHAKDCRELAAKTFRPEERKIFEDIAKSWQKLAALREYDLVKNDLENNE